MRRRRTRSGSERRLAGRGRGAGRGDRGAGQSGAGGASGGAWVGGGASLARAGAGAPGGHPDPRPHARDLPAGERHRARGARAGRRVEGPHARRRPPGQPAAHPGAGFRHPELRARRHHRVPSRRLRLPRERRLHRHGPRRRQGRAGPSGRRTAVPALGQCVALSGPLRHRADRVARRRPDPLDAQPQGTPRPRQPSPGAGPGQWRRGGDRGDRIQAGALPRRRAGVQYRAHRPAAPPSRSRVLLDRAFCTGPDGAGGDRRAGRRRLGRPRAFSCRAQPGLRGVPAADRRPGGADRAPGCCSASPFDPPESKRINVLSRRSASNLRA